MTHPPEPETGPQPLAPQPVDPNRELTPEQQADVERALAAMALRVHTPIAVAEQRSDGLPVTGQICWSDQEPWYCDTWVWAMQRITTLLPQAPVSGPPCDAYPYPVFGTPIRASNGFRRDRTSGDTDEGDDETHDDGTHTHEHEHAQNVPPTV